MTLMQLLIHIQYCPHANLKFTCGQTVVSLTPIVGVACELALTSHQKIHVRVTKMEEALCKVYHRTYGKS